MRIDYVMLDEALLPRVRRATVIGRGPERDGFLGSDHCPLIVELGDVEDGGESSSAGAAIAAQTAT